MKTLRITAFTPDDEDTNERVYDIFLIPEEKVFTNRNSLGPKVTKIIRDLLDNEAWVSRITIDRVDSP